MSGSMNRIKGQQGFSMAEVVVAVVLFVASILGVSVMLVSGGQNVTRGAKESAAANLAQKKIEEVKSLPFYRPWEGTNKDIDDFYWSFNAGYPRPNDQQLANPVVEDYGSIPGYGSYKRTTAVQYKYVNGSSLADAVMDPSWVPKSPIEPQFDRPTGGPAGGPYSTIHAVMIEVKVYYRSDTGAEKSYSAQGLAGDLMVTGGTNSPPLIINSITPSYGWYMSDTNLEVTLYVSTPPGTLNASSDLDVYLWYPGVSDIHAIAGTPTANAAGTEITCNFNLAYSVSNPVRPGYYNISVYWMDKGWVASFRDNTFEVRVGPPTIASLSANTWGYSGQTSRQVTVTGTNFWDCTVRLVGPNPSNTYSINGAVVSNNGTTLVCTFNLTGSLAERPNNTRWNVEVTAAGGTVTSDADAKRFRLNPPPTITQITPTLAGSYYNWAWKTQTARRVRIEGNYLYGFNDSTNRQGKLSWNGMNTSNATFISGQQGNSANSTGPVVLEFNPNSAIGDCTVAPYHAEVHNTRWDFKVLGNWGTATSDTDVKRVLMNPAPQVTSITGIVNGYRKTGTVSTITINGQYFQDSVGFYFINNNGTYPSGYNQTAIIGMGGSTSADGTQITGVAENLNKDQFHDWYGWGVLAGTSAALNSTTYITLLQNGNYDWQSVWPAYSATLSHAPIAINYTGNTYQYNNWDQGMANITGNYFYPGETSFALYTTGGDWAGANPSSVSTIQGGSISGGYGPGQSITGMSTNCINLPPAVYKIKVQDTENGIWAATQSDFTCAYQAPTGTLTDAKQGTGIGVGSGSGGTSGWATYTNAPRATISSTITGLRGLYNVSTVTWNSPMWYAYKDSSCIAGFSSCGVGFSNPGNFTFTSTAATLNANRAGKSISVSYTIQPFKRFNWTTWTQSCFWNSCTSSGYNYLDYKQSASGGGDVNNITLNGGWGSTVKNSPNITF